MKLTFRQLADYPLKPVEEVVCDGKVIGLLERQKNRTYKAFTGSGFDCRYLALYPSKHEAAVVILASTL